MRIIRFVDENDEQKDSASQSAGAGDKKKELRATNRFRLWSSKSNYIERAPRYVVAFDAELRVNGFFSSKMLGRAETVDISMSGAKIMFPQAIGFGTKLRLRINDFSSRAYMSVVANVVRCRRNYAGGAAYPVYEIGISFRNMSRRKSNLLMKWIRGCERFGSASFVH